MGKWRDRQGQSLVEVAVLLPLVCGAIAVTFQIIASCYNAVFLERMVYSSARDIMAEMPMTPLWLTHNPLWGRGAVPLRRRSTQVPQPWRPFNAVSRIEAPGHVTSVQVSSLLLPTGGFGEGLPVIHQQATAAAFLEPPVPEDQ